MGFCGGGQGSEEVVQQDYESRAGRSCARKLLLPRGLCEHADHFQVEVGAEEAWETSTKNNTTHPTWNETHDFVVSDYDQCIRFEIEDHDVNSNDEIGLGVTTVKEILLAGGKQDLQFTKDGKEIDGTLSVRGEFFQLVKDGDGFSASEHQGDGLLSGLVTVLVAGASGIKGQRADLHPSVAVSWGQQHRFQTAVKSDDPGAGTDTCNPRFDQSFRFPITAGQISGNGSFKLALIDGQTDGKEIGSVEIPYADMLKAKDMVLADSFAVGNGATIRASFCVRGIQHHTLQQSEVPQSNLPARPKNK